MSTISVECSVSSLSKAFCGEWVVITHTGNSTLKDCYGLCVALHGTLESLDVGFEDGTRPDGLAVETVGPGYFEGGLGRVAGRRKVQLVSAVREPTTLNRLQRVRYSEYFRVRRAALKAAEESLGNLLLGEIIPHAISRGETGETVVPVGCRVSKSAIRAIVRMDRSSFEMEPSMARVTIVKTLEPHWRKLLELEADYKLGLLRAEKE